MGQRTVKVIFGFLKQCGYGPEKRLCFRCGVDGRRIVARNTARLQFPDPVPTGRGRQGPVAGQMVFGANLIELRVVKAAEFRRQAAQHPNQSELHCDVMNDKAEPRLLGEHEAMFGFSLHLEQRLASKEKGRV